MNISIKKLVGVRQAKEYENIAEGKEKYACEVAGVEYNDKFFESRQARPIEFDIYVKSVLKTKINRTKF